MSEWLWLTLPFLTSLGSGWLVYIVVQARNEAVLARERERLAEVRTELIHQQKGIEDRVRAARAEARRLALDEFLEDVRVEERRFVREVESPDCRRKCLVVQERICFRNIPLSHWIERELDAAAEMPPIGTTAPPPRLEMASHRRRLLR